MLSSNVSGFSCARIGSVVVFNVIAASAIPIVFLIEGLKFIFILISKLLIKKICFFYNSPNGELYTVQVGNLNKKLNL